MIWKSFTSFWNVFAKISTIQVTISSKLSTFVSEQSRCYRSYNLSRLKRSNLRQSWIFHQCRNHRFLSSHHSLDLKNLFLFVHLNRIEKLVLQSSSRWKIERSLILMNFMINSQHDFFKTLESRNKMMLNKSRIEFLKIIVIKSELSHRHHNDFIMIDFQHVVIISHRLAQFDIWIEMNALFVTIFMSTNDAINLETNQSHRRRLHMIDNVLKSKIIMSRSNIEEI